MSIKNSDSELWDKDWFLSLDGESMLLLKFIFDKNNHVGIWEPNATLFSKLTGFKVDLKKFLADINRDCKKDKPRIIELANGRWFICKSIHFNWFRKQKVFRLGLWSRLHKSLYDELISNGVDFKYVEGLEGIDATDEQGFSKESAEVKLSELLLSLIVKRKKDFKLPDIQKWASDADKMIRLDKRDPERIRKVIIWCQNDSGDDKWPGWQNNILSISKLRIQFDKLEIAMNKNQFKKVISKPVKYTKTIDNADGSRHLITCHTEDGKEVIDKTEKLKPMSNETKAKLRKIGVGTGQQSNGEPTKLGKIIKK